MIFIELPSRILRRVGRYRVMKQMQRSSFPGTRAIAGAVAAVMAHRLEKAERTWIVRIEALRRNLAAQTEKVITFIDYGAGEPTDKFLSEDMIRGRPVTRTVADICQHAAVAYKWRLLLFRLIRVFNPSSCIELGTSLGLSAAYQAAALELNGRGNLTTLEGSEALAAIAQENFRTLGLDRVRIQVGRFQDTLESVLRVNAPVDFVFVDGHHDEDATVGYFGQMLPHLTDNAVLVLDDILWYEGMQRAWGRLIEHQRVRLAVDLGVVGVLVVSTEAQPAEHYAIPSAGWSMMGLLRRGTTRSGLRS